MTHSTITSKGQTTIPGKIRKALRIKPGDRLEYVGEGDHATIRVPRCTRMVAWSPSTTYSSLSPGLIRNALRIFPGIVVCPLLVIVECVICDSYSSDTFLRLDYRLLLVSDQGQALVSLCTGGRLSLPISSARYFFWTGKSTVR